MKLQEFAVHKIARVWRHMETTDNKVVAWRPALAAGLPLEVQPAPSRAVVFEIAKVKVKDNGPEQALAAFPHDRRLYADPGVDCQSNPPRDSGAPDRHAGTAIAEATGAQLRICGYTPYHRSFAV